MDQGRLESRVQPEEAVNEEPAGRQEEGSRSPEMGCHTGKVSCGLATPPAVAAGGFAASPSAARQSPGAE